MQDLTPKMREWFQERQKRLALRLAPLWAGWTRVPVQIALGEEERLPGEQVLGEAGDDLLLFAGPRRCGTWLAEFSPGLLRVLVQKMLGGRTELAARARAWSPVEARIAQRAIQGLQDAWSWAWQAELQGSLTWLADPAAAGGQRAAAAQQTLLRVRARVQVGDQRGTLTLAVPWLLAERCGPPGDSDVLNEGPSDATARVRPEYQEVTLELSPGAISAFELLDLRVGDLLTTDHEVDRAARVCVAGSPRFAARLGARGPFKAVQLLPLDELRESL